MNNINRYFGAYLEVRVNKVEYEDSYLACENGHRVGGGSFCIQCGSPITKHLGTVSEYPTDIYGLIGEEWLDVLAIITPPELYGTGIILVRSNMRPGGEWLYLDRWDVMVQTKDFPTDTEQQEMMREFEGNHADVIEAIRQADGVVGVTIKAGYVLVSEY